MNVVHIITRLIVGGAQENTLQTVEEQHAVYGDQVTLVTGPSPGPEGSLLDRAQRGGFPVIVLEDLHRSIAPYADWKSYRRFTDILKTIRPDIVHTHSSKAGILGRAAAARVGIPAVHTVHGASFHYGQSRVAHAAYIHAEKWAARRTAHFISVADAMTDEYVAQAIAPRSRFTTIYSGFDVEPFLNPPRDRTTVRSEWGFTDEHFVIGKIGRLFPLKGQEFVIVAAPEIVRQHPNARFVLVGDGILRGEYETRIRDMGLADHFVFTGLVPPAKIPEFVHAMDTVVHTSQWEGLARVLPQALIAGKPVVSFDVGGAREVVIPETTGFLIPRDDVAALVEAVSRLAGDESLCRRLGAEGRLLCTDRFRYQTMVRQIRDVYSQVLSGQPMSS